MTERNELEVNALLRLAEKIGELNGKLDSVILQQAEYRAREERQDAAMRLVTDKIHAVELAASSKKRPLVIGMGGAAGMSALFEIVKFWASS